MKPSKNKVFCKDCGRTKMLFESEKKAQTFIKFNSAEIENESGVSPIRSYFCIYCGGWHVTSKTEAINPNIKSKSEITIDAYHLNKERKILENKKNQVIRQQQISRINELFVLIEDNIKALEALINADNVNESNEISKKIIEFIDESKTIKGFSKRKNELETKFKSIYQI